ncbi:MAG: sigma-70 family RNA polymerase sigma factor [Clostridia bacterium]|nr:sigma-70 family RNA polymerase sigma factor [Clostridia bacterium]
MTDIEVLYEAYFNDVYLYILRLSGSRQIAEDITSDTFFKAMKAVGSFRGDCDVRVWLCQIAKNAYYSFLKKNDGGKLVSTDDVCDLEDAAPGLAEEWVRKDEIRRIQRVLHRIDEPYKEVFMWRIYGELSFKQIAQIFGKTENWACVTYHRARKMIKARLEEKDCEN